MAQTGYTPISIYYSSTAAATPTAGNLVAGELAINTADGKLFYKDSSGVVQTLASKGTGTIGGSTTQVQYNNAGAFAGSANFVWDNTNVRLGIGTASPSVRLEVSSGNILATQAAGSNCEVSIAGNGNTAATSLQLRQNSSNQALINNRANAEMLFQTNNTERMRIDTSGNVGIGTTTASGKLNVSSSVGTGIGTNQNTLSLFSTATAGVGVGPMLSFQGNTGNSTTPYGFGGIAGFKESATAGNYAGSLAFYTQSAGGASTYTEAMRIDSSGNVGIGTASPSVASGLGLVLNGAGSQTRLAFKNTTTGDGANDGLQIGIDVAGEAFIEQRESLALRFSTNATERMRINAGAPILCLSGGNTTATGTGIAFPATQSASSDANCLDDYEEGIWTASSGTANITVANTSGSYYTKVGRLVTLYAYVTITNSTGSTQTSMQLTGLPFVSQSYGFGATYYQGTNAYPGQTYTESAQTYALLGVTLATGANSVMVYFSYFTT